MRTSIGPEVGNHQMFAVIVQSPTAVFVIMNYWKIPVSFFPETCTIWSELQLCVEVSFSKLLLLCVKVSFSACSLSAWNTCFKLFVCLLSLYIASLLLVKCMVIVCQGGSREPVLSDQLLRHYSWSPKAGGPLGREIFVWN